MIHLELFIQNIESLDEATNLYRLRLESMNFSDPTQVERVLNSTLTTKIGTTRPVAAPKDGESTLFYNVVEDILYQWDDVADPRDEPEMLWTINTTNASTYNYVYLYYLQKFKKFLN